MQHELIVSTDIEFGVLVTNENGAYPRLLYSLRFLCTLMAMPLIHGKQTQAISDHLTYAEPT